jgi:hypothetical protein
MTVQILSMLVQQPIQQPIKKKMVGFYVCKDCKVESVREDPSGGYYVCTLCGLVNHDWYTLQSLESKGCSTIEVDAPNDENRDRWLLVMKVPVTLVNKMYTELEDVKYGNIREELVGLVYLSKREHIKFGWEAVAKELEIEKHVIMKKVNMKLGNMNEGVEELLEKFQRNLTEDQYEKAITIASKMGDVARTPTLIVAGILSRVTGDEGWYDKLQVCVSSKRAIINELDASVGGEYKSSKKRPTREIEQQ